LRNKDLTSALGTWSKVPSVIGIGNPRKVFNLNELSVKY
jgi:hypothetical protein